MITHKQGIMILGVIVALACTIGISIAGTPISQRLINFDATRLSDFTNMKYRAENYFRSNSRIPYNMSDLANGGELPTDPESGNQYEYQKVTDSSYKFCTVFSTDSVEIRKKGQALNTYDTSYPENDNQTHKKGYDCITYMIPDYMLNDQKSPTIVPYRLPTAQPTSKRPTPTVPPYRLQ